MMGKYAALFRVGKYIKQTSLNSLNNFPDVYLQVLYVIMKGANDQEKWVTALFYTGSQRSYV